VIANNMHARAVRPMIPRAVAGAVRYGILGKLPIAALGLYQIEGKPTPLVPGLPLEKLVGMTRTKLA